MMGLLIIILALSQLSHALHFGHKTKDTTRHMLKHVPQNEAAQSPATTGTNLKRPSRPILWWKLPKTNNGEIDALTGQHFHPFDESANGSDDDSTGPLNSHFICPINRCQSSGIFDMFHCGEHARCISSFCQCDLGWKPVGSTSMTQGWSGLEALTVWVDAYTAGCTERCDSLSCSEVPQIRGCFDGSKIYSDKDGDKGEGKGHADQKDLTTDVLHLGAIKAPAADAGIGS
jgi:hypothetical protein